MGVDQEPAPTEQRPELSRVERLSNPPVDDSKRVASFVIKAEEDAAEAAARKRDQIKISEVKGSLALESASGENNIRQHFLTYRGVGQKDIERIQILKVKDLPGYYQSQREFLRDERLDEISIAIVPDDIWKNIKGSQPSQSDAENGLISFKQSYFEAEESPDKSAWLCHELAHCQNYLDSESLAEYQGNMHKLAFEDIKTEYTYPNNLVEKFTFTKQFQYLKQQGKSREDILKMLSNEYNEEDFPFFNRLMDGVYAK